MNEEPEMSMENGIMTKFPQKTMTKFPQKTMTKLTLLNMTERSKGGQIQRYSSDLIP